MDGEEVDGMTERILALNDVEDLCIGAGVLGTGGGGTIATGIRFLRSMIEFGAPVTLASAHDLADEAIVAVPGGVGSVAPVLSPLQKSLYERWDALFTTEENPYLVALRALERFIGKRISATIPSEMGGYNTACAAMVAASAGIVFVDCDLAGRAVPEVGQSSFAIRGLRQTPFAISDIWGDVMIVEEVESHLRAEAISRALSVIGEGNASVVSYPITWAEAKDAIVPGTVSLAMAIGNAIHTARKAGEDPAAAAVRTANGVEIFRGEVRRVEWKDRDGFMWGDAWLSGEGRWHGRSLRAWFKNETLLTWLDDSPYVTCPDLICTVDAHTGSPVTNTQLCEGMTLLLFARKAAQCWYTPEGMDLLSPAHFGFDVQHVPVDEIMEA